MKLNFNLKSSLYALALLAGMSACTSETEFQNNEGDGQLTSQSGIRFVIQTPSPDAIVTRTVAGDQQENEVKTMSLYIFAKNDKAAGDGDDQYTLLKKKEGITFETSGTPGTSGTNSGSSLSYTEPITADMIGRQVKMLLVANDKVASADVTTTTLAAFKQSAATAVAADNGSADAVSGNIFAANNTGYTGLVMSAVAYSGDTEGQNEAVVLTPLGVDMKANFQRIVARIDLIHAIPNMTLTGVKVLNAPSKGYLFPQTSLPAPDDASTVTLLPTSGYDSQLKPTGNGIIFNDGPDADNTLKHVFYLYEKANGAADCVTVEISYTLKMGNWEKPGKLDVKFQKSANDGSDYVNTVRNTLYTIQMGDGNEATDVNNVTTLKVEDWVSEDEIDESFTPNDDTHSEVIAPADAEIGDYYLSDGTLRRSNYQFTPAEKAKVIGVVFQTDPDRIGKAEKDALSAKEVTTPHGLVMSTKLANDGELCTWGPESDEALDDIAMFQSAYNDISGLANYQKVKDADADFTTHPAFKAVAEFKVEAPEKSTGWFLPSSGQLWDFVENLGSFTEKMKEQHTNSNTAGYLRFYYNNDATTADENVYLGPITTAQQQINTKLSPLGNNAELVVDGITYWTSTEGSAEAARAISFYTTNFLFGSGGKTAPCYVRPILAF